MAVARNDEMQVNMVKNESGSKEEVKGVGSGEWKSSVCIFSWTVGRTVLETD